MLADFALLLRGDRVEATTTGIPFYGNYGKTVAVTVTDFLVAGEETGFHMLFGFSGHLPEMFFFLLISSDDLFQFAFFSRQNAFFSGNILLGFFEQDGFLRNFFVGVLDMFFSQLHFQLLHFNFFVDRFELPIVLYILTLLFVFGNQGFGFLDGFTTLLNEFRHTIDFFLDTGLTGMQTSDLIFQVSYFHRQLPFQDLDLIHFTLDLLECNQGGQFFFYGKFFNVCHFQV